MIQDELPLPPVAPTFLEAVAEVWPFFALITALLIAVLP